MRLKNLDSDVYPLVFRHLGTTNMKSVARAEPALAGAAREVLGQRKRLAGLLQPRVKRSAALVAALRQGMHIAKMPSYKPRLKTRDVTLQHVGRWVALDNPFPERIVYKAIKFWRGHAFVEVLENRDSMSMTVAYADARGNLPHRVMLADTTWIRGQWWVEELHDPRVPTILMKQVVAALHEALQGERIGRDPRPRRVRRGERVVRW